MVITVPKFYIHKCNRFFKMLQSVFQLRLKSFLQIYILSSLIILQLQCMPSNDEENVFKKSSLPSATPPPSPSSLVGFINDDDNDNDNDDFHMKQIVANVTHWTIEDAQDYDISTLHALTTVTNNCLQRCINEESLFLNDFDVKCLSGDKRPQCFLPRCFKGCECWWQALREYETCQEACASLQFYPFDLPCISACELSQRAFWHFQRLLIRNVVNSIKPQLLLDEQFIHTLTLQWPIIQQFTQQDEQESEQRQHQHQHHHYLTNRPFNIQYQYVPATDDSDAVDHHHDITNLSVWWNLLDYNCNDEFECDITDSLMAFTNYRFRFVLMFGDDMDDVLYSPPSDVYTTSAWGKPLSAPIITSTVVIDHRQAVTFWQAGKFINGPLKNYKLKLMPSHSNVTEEKLLSNQATYYIFNDLLPFTNYSLQISMVNDEGDGPMATTFFHTMKITKPSITVDNLEYVLLAGKYSIVLKSMDSLSENKVIYKSSQLLSDFDYHHQLRLIFVLNVLGDLYSFSLDNPLKHTKLLKEILNNDFKMLKLSIDWLNDKVYVAGEFPGKSWQILCLDYNGTILETITENLTSSLQQVTVDAINGWLFMLDTNGNLLYLNLATKVIKAMVTAQPLLSSPPNGIIGYFCNNFRHYSLLVYNTTDKELYRFSYDGLYRHKLKQQMRLQKGLLQSFSYLNSQSTIIVGTNGTHILWHDYETSEEYNWVIAEMEWCWKLVPILQQRYHHLQHELPKPREAPQKLTALLTAQMAKISWQPNALVEQFQTAAAWQQWDYELEIMDVASNSAFNIRNIKTLYFKVERLQPNNQYCIKVRASLPGVTTTLSQGILSDWSEELKVRTWPVGEHKLIWATEQGLYETNEVGEQIESKIRNNKEIISLIKVNSTLFYIDRETQQFECMNYMNPDINCSFAASNAYSVDYEGRSGKLYWSDTQRNCIIRRDLNGKLEELLPIFEARLIRLDSALGFLYYQTAYRLARRPLSGVSESLQIEYYHVQNSAERILGFVLVAQYQLIYWLVAQQENLTILYKTSLDSTAKVERYVLEHEVTADSLEYLMDIDSFIWLKKDGHTAVIAPRTNIKQYAEFDTPFKTKSFIVKLKNDFTFHVDTNIIPGTVDPQSIQISDGYWDDFNINWSSVRMPDNFTIFYKILVEAKDQNQSHLLTFEVTEPMVRIIDFKVPNHSLNVTITPHTYWRAGSAQSKELRAPAAAPKQPRNLRIFVESVMHPLQNEPNITAIVRWDAPEDILSNSGSGNLDIVYKVYCWLDDNLVEVKDLEQQENHLTHEINFTRLKTMETYNFEIQAFAMGRSIGGEKTSLITYHINPAIQSTPKLIFGTIEFIGEIDLDLNTTKILIHTSAEVEHLCIIRGEERFVWVNENVELMTYKPGTAVVKLARMRAEVTALTVDWIQRNIYWAELSGDLNKTMDIYQLNLYRYEGKIMQGSKLLTTTSGKFINNLMILPYSQLLVWLEYDRQTSNATLAAWSLRDKRNIKLKTLSGLKYAFEGSLTSEIETINLVDNKGKLCAYDVQRQLCNWLKIPLYNQFEHLTRDAGYIYTLYNNTLKAYNRRKQNLEYMLKMEGVKLMKAYNYQEYPMEKCLLPQISYLNRDEFDSLVIKDKGETFITLKFPTKTNDSNCMLQIPGLKFTLKIAKDLKAVKTYNSFESLINITNLKPFTIYTCSVTVSSYYQQKLGLPMLVYPPFQVTTAESNPTKPRNFTAYALSPTEVWVSWLEPEYKNAAKLHYELHWQMENSTLKAFRQVDRFTVILSNLESSQDYLIWLEVYSVESKRNSTQALNVRTYDMPASLELVDIQAYNLTLTWPDNFTYEKVYLEWHSVMISSDKDHLIDMDISLSKQNNITIPNLQPKTKYEFHLKLLYKNVKRQYLWPEQPYEGFVYETLGDAPSDPGQPQFEHITGEIFKVYWEPARNHGSTITEYSLEALQARHNKRIRRSDSSQSSSILTMAQMPWVEELPPLEDKWFVYCNTSELSCIVKELYSKRLVMFRVRARNEPFGWGPYSKESPHIVEPFVTPQKRHSLVWAIIAPAAIVSSCVIALVILRKIQRRRVKANQLLDKSRPSIWSNLSSLQQEILLRNRAFSLTSNSTMYKESPLTDADIALLPHIQWNQITLIKFLGSGAFGEVYEGLIKQNGEEQPEKVAIKSLRKGASEFAELLQEAQLMSNFRHENIIRLIGVCCETESISIIMEHMEGGDLLTFLREARSNSGKHMVSLHLLDLLNMCIDVATGMTYLEDMHFVHRDLACRNCLVSSVESSKRVVKIGDFGLARDIYKSDYYRKEGEGLMPVRWMALESLIDGIFTIQTDVWSFGVLCWEILTLGQQPYAGRNNFEVLNYVKDGGRLEQPKNCPDKMFLLMLQCWHEEAEERFTFRKCLNTLLTIKTDVRRYSVSPSNDGQLYANLNALKTNNITEKDIKPQAQAEVYAERDALKSSLPNERLNLKVHFNQERNSKDFAIETESDISELLDCKYQKSIDHPDYYINEGISRL